MSKSKFLESKEFFPLNILFEDGVKEKISIVKRPRIGNSDSDIVDFYANGSHIGMIIQIRKTEDEIQFGASVVNTPFDFRNILPFAFTKMLEYYGLQGIKTIKVLEPKNIEFKQFLIDLGFENQNELYKIDISGEYGQKLIEKIQQMNIHISNKQEQLVNIINHLNRNKNKIDIDKMVDNLIEKVKKDESVKEEFWENRKIAQISTILTCAYLFKHKVPKEEFLDSIIKTVIAYFDFNARIPLMKEFLNCIKNNKTFSLPQVQKLIDLMRKVLGEEMQHIDENKYLEWAKENQKIWEIHYNLHKQIKETKQKNSVLRFEDFGDSIHPDFKQIVEAFINHYNGENIFYGIATKI